MKNNRERPPKHLTAAAKRLWLDIFAEVDLDRPALLLLDTLCEQFDRMDQARQILLRDGVTVKDRFDQEKPHPAVTIETSAAAAMMRAWRLLGFDQQPPGPIGRPPGT